MEDKHMTFRVTTKESADADQVFTTREEAERLVAEWEAKDKKDGDYTEGYYLIVEE